MSGGGAPSTLDRTRVRGVPGVDMISGWKCGGGGMYYCILFFHAHAVAARRV